MARVGFLGTGTIAAAMVGALAGQGHEIRISPRNGARARALAQAHPEVAILPNADVVAGSDVVILCLMAQTARDALPGLPWREDHEVISVMADMGLAELSRLCAPAGRIAVTIPLPFIARGGCPLPCHPDSPALRRLFGGKNPVLVQRDEAALAAHFIATALCSPVLDQLRAASGWLAGHGVERGAAETYVAALIAGMLGDLEGEGAFDRALADLATPGGLNATLRAHMEGTPDRLTAGMERLAPRLGL